MGDKPEPQASLLPTINQTSVTSSIAAQTSPSLVMHNNTDVLSKFNLTDDQFHMLLERVYPNKRSASSRPLSDFPATEIDSASGIPAFALAPDTALNLPIREFLFDDFSFVPPSVILEIVCYKFHAFDLYKLDNLAGEGEGPNEGAREDHASRAIEEKSFPVEKRHSESSGSSKTYPTFASLLQPLLIYFDILGTHAASSGNAAATLTILKGCTAYCAHLSELNAKYEWSAVLWYHKDFFAKRSKEMANGIYSGWVTADHTIINKFLFRYLRSEKPPPVPLKSPRDTVQVRFRR